MRPAAAHLGSVARAEAVKLLSRRLVRVALVFCALVGLLGPLALRAAQAVTVEVSGAPVPALDPTAPLGLQWALEIRNFFFFRVFLVMATAVSFAAELRAHTLREELLHPLPRWVLLAGRLVALALFATLGAGVTWLVASVTGLLLFGGSGAWGPPAAGYLATVLTDVGFVVTVLAAAVLLRSVAATIGGMILVVVLDRFLGWSLSFAALLAQQGALPEGLRLAVEARPWLPSSAWGAWSGYAARADWQWESFVALAVYTALSWVVAEQVFRRMDVP